MRSHANCSFEQIRHASYVESVICVPVTSTWHVACGTGDVGKWPSSVLEYCALHKQGTRCGWFGRKGKLMTVGASRDGTEPR